MSKITKSLLAAAVVACTGATVQAGDTYVASSKTMMTPMTDESLYNAEWQVSIFGTYAFSESTNERIFGDHAWGGGLAVNYFFNKYIGVGLEGQYLDVHSGDGLGSAAINVFYRYPVGHWAPYVYLGGGAIFNANNISRSEFADEFDSDDRNNNSTEIEGHGGLGIEYRFTKHVGVFTDARWNVVEDQKNNFPSIRTGVTFAF